MLLNALMKKDLFLAIDAATQSSNKEENEQEIKKKNYLSAK
jgi:hypothetical protein